MLAGAVLIGLVALSANLATQGQVHTVTALVGGTLVDGNGGPPIRNSVVLIDRDRVTAVGQVGATAIPPGAEVLSTEGMTVLPGLWDAHVHTHFSGHADYGHWDKAYASQLETVIMPASAKQLLMAGITSAPGGADLRIRRQRLPNPETIGETARFSARPAAPEGGTSTRLLPTW